MNMFGKLKLLEEWLVTDEWPPAMLETRWMASMKQIFNGLPWDSCSR